MSYCDFCNSPLDHKGQCVDCGEFDPFVVREHKEFWLESSHSQWQDEEIMGA